ncbi:cholecystokinin receptor-like [Uloborus diversus]|uniref:cholecystokinin receptor-like n=1 Tax=Uloborus diversus TaxID=327109 RepID=UPI0024098F5C|nr:cholecystokinin receptor-like [Uloborus diversus]
MTDQLLINETTSVLYHTITRYEEINAPATSPAPSAGINSLDLLHLILPYSAIFVLAVSGNILVIVTLLVNKRMRTVTNVFLFNLAISDFLLGVFCMPFTLTGVLYREFLFGSALCKLIPYFQAVSVSVSAWTLVSMSVERYFAICHPLKSRKWQTLSHAYKMIAVVWMGSLIFMLPILILSQLQNIKGTDKHKCREQWPSLTAEKSFTVFLDVFLLLLPLVLMSATYSLIIRTLWQTMVVSAGESQVTENEVRFCWKTSPNLNRHTTTSTMSTFTSTINSATFNSTPGTLSGEPTMRKSNVERGIIQKKRIIKMLFVVVLEFFICWTPLYIINTISLFDPSIVYSKIGYNGICFLQLLAYTSSCCNPVTYCFMNSRFRESFCRLFPCNCKNIR